MNCLISFARNSYPAFEVPAGSNLMQALLAQGIPVASSCNGDGVCAKCRIKVTGEPTSLPPANDTEKFLAEVHELEGSERISCQVEVHGPITVDTSYW